MVAEGGVVFWSGRLEQTGGCRGGGRVSSLVSLDRLVDAEGKVVFLVWSVC